jgi:subtilase family serine protease
VLSHPHEDTDEVGRSIDLAGLPANSSQILSPCFYTYPGNGEMAWRAVVDADDDIQNEMHEDNNEMRGTVYIEGGEE